MKKITVGYIFNEKRLSKDEKAFLKMAKKKGINLVLINTEKFFDEEEMEQLADKCDVFFNNSAEDISLEVAKTLEALGKKVFDPSEEAYYSEDKWMFFLKCKKHKIPTPFTVLLSDTKPAIKKEIKELNSWPVILKRIYGTQGQFVEKADNFQQVEKIIDKFWKKGSERFPIIAQEFVRSPSYRILVIDGKIAQTAIKRSHGWKATGVYATKIDKFKVDKQLKDIIKKLTKAYNLKVFGADLFKKDGKWIVCEINSDPAFDFFENEREKVIYEVLSFLKKQVR